MDAAADAPDSVTKGLCACVSCHLVKTFDQFDRKGCENCPFLAMKDDPARVGDCTTVEFSGLISVVDPTASWAAQWLGLAACAPGAYAIKVRPTEVPAAVEEALAERGVDWRARARD